MTPLIDNFPPETDAKVFGGAFSGRKEKAPDDYRLPQIAMMLQLDHLVGKQITTFLMGGYQANGEVICGIGDDKTIQHLVLRSYENDLIRYYYVNPASITCLSFVDQERKTIKTDEEKLVSRDFISNRDLGDEAYQAEAHPI